MNPEAWQKLESIYSKEPHELNDDEKGFLRARRFYMTSDMLAKYADILKIGKIEIAEGKPNETEERLKVAGLELKDMNLEQLLIVAKGLNIRGAHLFNDENRLRQVIVERQEQIKRESK